jgi:tRNA G37 N-methylase TrmD
MNDLLFAISIITSIVWSVGYFAFKAGEMIHFFLVIAVVSTLVQVMRRKRSITFSKKTIKS